MAPSRSFRSQKKQMRLQFESLPSSSPAKGNYSSAIQDRLANVRFENTRRTRARAAKDEEESLPTPQPTSPAAAEQEPDQSSPLSSLRTSPVVPPRFSQFTKPHGSVNGLHQIEDEDDEDIIPPSSKRVKVSTVTEDSVPRKTLSTLRGAGNTVSTPTRRSSRLVKQDGSGTQPVFTDTMSSQMRLADWASSESSDDDTMATKPLTKNFKMSKKSYDHDPFIIPDDAESSVPEEATRPRKRASKWRQKEKGFVVDNDEVEYITSDDSGRGPSENSGEGNRIQQDKSRTRRLNRRSKREQEELAEDLLDLQDSDHEEDTPISRTRGGPVMTQRDKARQHFELLKRRRAGEKVPRVIDSDGEDYDHDDGFHMDKIGEDRDNIEVLSVSSSEPLEAQAQAQGYDELPALEDDDDFVVEDESTGGRLGRLNNDIPLQFTSFASAKPQELFPHIIEWMVKNKVSPAFDRHDELYNLSFSRLDDQVKAQAGSRLISSAWNATFKHAILARPGIRVIALPGLDEELIRTCDACNKTNHPAKYDFSLSGKAYSKDTLEPVDDSDDEGDEDNDDAVSRDELGHVLASTNMHFYLGRFCAANAEMGHKLTHWKHHLNEQVLSYLEEQGVLSADAIIRREKLNKKKREKEAENVVDMMQETGMIAELWQAFQDDLEDARIGMEGLERKGGRSKGRIGSVRVQRENGAVGEWLDGGKYRQIATRLESDSEGE